MPFRIIIAAIVLPLQAFLFLRFWTWLRGQTGLARHARLPGVAAFLVFNAILVYFALNGFNSTRVSTGVRTFIVYPFLFWHFWTFVVALPLLIGALLKLPFKGVRAGLRAIPAFRPRVEAISSHPTVQRFDASRRTFLRRGAYALTAASFGGTAYGMLVERTKHQVSETIIRIPGLPPAFSGYSIGLVTDVHSSMYMTAADMRRYVRVLNGMGSDIILVGGDLVNGSGDEVLPFAEAFSALRAPDGVYGVLGNHDFYTREADRVAHVAGEAGVRILRDESMVIHRHGAALTFLGIDDTGTGSVAMQRVQRAVNGTPAGPRILLCHRPYFFEAFADGGIDLTLSGHTHGGQVVLGEFAGMTFTPAALASPYLAGLYHSGTSQMYVSRGIGTVGVPVRLNCPPELTRIVLKPA